MLSRRHLRIKVLHALYEYFQNPGADMARGTKKLREKIDSIYDLYLYELKALHDIFRIAEQDIDRRKNKRLPSKEDLNPNLRFVENPFLKWLEEDETFRKQVEQNHISWSDDREILRRIYKEFVQSEEYQQYMNAAESTLEDDKRIVKQLYGIYIVHDEAMQQFYEERNLHWADDLDAAQMMVAKTIKKFKDPEEEVNRLPRLIKDQDDVEFAMTLFTKSIVNSNDYQQMILEKATNWEVDRIAMIDIILMKQALAEMTSFKEIPVKVSLNEYIELSKEYSTPKSSNFINGILDKIKADLQNSGEIRKIGRGLL